MQKTGISNEQFAAAAAAIGCDIATIKAVRQVEAPRGPFDDHGRPTILFEPYIFYKSLKKNGAAVATLLTSPVYKKAKILSTIWDPKLYGTFSEQYPKLAIASQIAERLALESTSFGSFQILGANYAACGFDNVSDFVEAMKESESRQLELFVKFILSNHIDDELRAHDWAGFAALYNGPLYRKNAYDVNLKKAYRLFANIPA